MTPIEPDNTYPVTEPYWVELCRQEFCRRYFNDDCGRSDPRGDHPYLRGTRVDFAGGGVRVSEQFGTTNANKAA